MLDSPVSMTNMGDEKGLKSHFHHYISNRYKTCFLLSYHYLAGVRFCPGQVQDGKVVVSCLGSGIWPTNEIQGWTQEVFYMCPIHFI